MRGDILVTASLLDSYSFAISAPPSWKSRALAGFIQQIRREKGDYPSWVTAGIDFEDAVYKVCNRSKTFLKAMEVDSSKEFKKVVQACYGGEFQKKLSKRLTIDGNKCYFFGKLDVDFKEMTKDIKTCIKWSGKSKYLKKIQHKLYLWMNDKFKFEYVVVHWKDHEKEPNVIRRVHTIEYTNPGHTILENDIVQLTRSMLQFIHEQGLWEDYYFTFSRN